MKTLEIIGYKRANLGKSESKRLRAESHVPAVLYGGEGQVHFYAPMILFRDLVYTDEAHYVTLNIEGDIYQAILQDIQFHPVSEIILHADFLQLHEGKPVKMEIPVHFVGTSVGVTKGGTLVRKRRKITIKALPKNMPEYLEVDITDLDFGKAVKVESVKEEGFEILDSKIASIAVVEIPRALRSAQAEEEEELAEAMEAAAEAEASADGEGGADDSSASE